MLGYKKNEKFYSVNFKSCRNAWIFLSNVRKPLLNILVKTQMYLKKTSLRTTSLPFVIYSCIHFKVWILLIAIYFIIVIDIRYVKNSWKLYFNTKIENCIFMTRIYILKYTRLCFNTRDRWELCIIWYETQRGELLYKINVEIITQHFCLLKLNYDKN